MILCLFLPVRHEADQVEVAIDLESLLDSQSRRSHILEDKALKVFNQRLQPRTQLWYVEQPQRIKFLEKVLLGHEHSLAIGPVKRHVVTFPQAVLVVDDDLEMQGCVFVAAFLHLDRDVPETLLGVPRPIDDEAAAESHVMKLLDVHPHFLGCDGAADESIGRPGIDEKHLVLLSKRCPDDVAQMA